MSRESFLIYLQCVSDSEEVIRYMVSVLLMICTEDVQEDMLGVPYAASVPGVLYFDYVLAGSPYAENVLGVLYL